MSSNYEVEKKKEYFDVEHQKKVKKFHNFKINIKAINNENINGKEFDETETYSCSEEKENNKTTIPSNTEVFNSQKEVNENQNILIYEPKTNENEIKSDGNSTNKISNIINVNINNYFISISDIYSQKNIIDIQIYYPIKKEKERNDGEMPNGNNKNDNMPMEEIKKEQKMKIINNVNIKNIENLKQNLNFNVNNGFLQNRFISNNIPPLMNNKAGINNNNIYNFYNIINNNLYNQKLAQLREQKLQFQQLKNLGLFAIKNPQNINHYLLNNFAKKNNNVNQYLPLNNNMNMNYNRMNYNNMNISGNPLLRNYLSNQYYMNNNINNIYNMNNNLKNLNILNNLNNINNLNNPNNLNNQKYTITLKSKTNDPTIEKVSKIQVTTYCVKDNSKKLENNEVIKKEKNVKNIINLDSILSGKETRTVVRLNPIPPNYSSFDVCKLLDKYLQIESGKNQRIYKALYTPLCKVIGKNLGYCFVMMAKPKYVIDFYKVFNGRIFGKKKCKKPCNVIWADVQGEDFLKECEDNPIRKPIIFKDIKTD
jgi:hypothetical protein